MQTLGKTGCGASGRYCFVNNLGMPQFRYQFYTAYCTDLRGRAGGIRASDMTAAKVGNDFLRHENFAANIAMRPLSKTGCGTSRSYCFVDCLTMTKAKDAIRANDRFGGNVFIPIIALFNRVPLLHRTSKSNLLKSSTVFESIISNTRYTIRNCDAS